MIYFFADDHYGTHAGRILWAQLPGELRRRTVFAENEWSFLEEGSWERDCDLLVLHCIGGTCGQPLAGAGAERTMRKYLSRGGNVLLLHGSSAAFWHWAWWRQMVGLRWVRPNDPDGLPASTHPHAPCRVVPTDMGRNLFPLLKTIDLQEDEIYINLQETAPVTILMTTEVAGMSYPQCCEARTTAGSRLVSFLPGHSEANLRNPKLVDNVAYLMVTV